jgi:DNA-binding PadR family transcriptional regulator
MARAVANLLGLAVLGTLVQRPMHRYEIATTIREQGKDDDMDVKWGSLYTVVQNLERHGFVEAAGTDRQGARPERTIYRITAAGRRELAEWTRELVATPRAEHPSFAAGLSMIAALPPEVAADLLQARLERLEASIAERRSSLAGSATQVPRLFLVEDEYGIAMQAAEAHWVRDLLGELRSGRFPDLALWRQSHDTGVMSGAEAPGEGAAPGA